MITTSPLPQISSVVWQWLLAAVWLLASLCLGLLAKRGIIPGLRRMVQKTAWSGDDLLISILCRFSLPWAVLGGLFAALHTVPLHAGFIDFGAKAVFVCLALSVTAALSRLVVGLVDDSFRRKGLPLASTSIIDNILRVAVFAVGILIVLQSLGISVTPALTALGVGGLAVALALQDTLSNLFSGIQLIAANQIRVGDFVRLDTGQEGHVFDVNWRTTSIKTLDEQLVILPNSKLAGAVVTNFHLPQKEGILGVEVGVAYDTDLDRAEGIILEVASQTLKDVDGGVTDFAPRVRFRRFGESSIDVTVFLRVREMADQPLVRSEFIKRLHRRFSQEGIVIPFPQRDLHVRNLPEGVVGKGGKDRA